MYPCHEARLTPEEQMLDDWLRLDNHFLARGLSLTHHDEPQRNPAQPSRAASPATFDPDPPTPDEVAEAYQHKYGELTC